VGELTVRGVTTFTAPTARALTVASVSWTGVDLLATDMVIVVDDSVDCTSLTSSSSGTARLVEPVGNPALSATYDSISGLKFDKAGT